jgi:hypothetical protein
MLARRRFLMSCFGVLSVLGAAFPPASLQAAGQKVTLAIVVSKDSPLSAISSRELKRLYLSEIVSGPDGEKLIALNQASGAADRVGFERTVLGMDPDEVGRYWIDRKIRGRSGPPKTVTPLERLRRAIVHVNGTIGYLRVSEVEGDLKVLSVDAKKPGEKGYPLEY